jgi:hypothetical protein
MGATGRLTAETAELLNRLQQRIFKAAGARADASPSGDWLSALLQAAVPDQSS